MTRAKKKKFIKNLWKFTAVYLAAVFGQLALGVTIQQASVFALAIFWGALADYFKKIK